MRKRLRSLAWLSRSLGQDPLLVQAGGGNTSVKLGSRMAIKASGVRLSSVTPERGWALAQLRDISQGLPALRGLRSERARELGYAGLLGRAGRSPGLRVSMEAGLHAVIPEPFVAHVHSVAGILAGLLPEPECRVLLREALGRGTPLRFVPACLPGMELTTLIQSRLGRRVSGVRLWILRNHGLVWAAENGPELLRASACLEERLRRHFELEKYPPPHRRGSPDCGESSAEAPSATMPSRLAWPLTRRVCFCSWPECRLDFRPLFPDFIVYFQLWGRAPADLLRTGPRSCWLGAKTIRELRDKEEVLFAQTLVATLAGRAGRALPRTMIRAIKGLETERLRIAQMGPR